MPTNTPISVPFSEIEHEAGVFDRLPSRLEQQPLLRIDIGRFARRDAEELRIELIDLIEKAAAFGDRFTRPRPAPDRNNAQCSTGPPGPR